MLNSIPALLIFYPKMSRWVVIRKCYARMSDPASGDKLSLEVLVSDGGLKIFIYYFNKGVGLSLMV